MLSGTFYNYFFFHICYFLTSILVIFFILFISSLIAAAFSKFNSRAARYISSSSPLIIIAILEGSMLNNLSSLKAFFFSLTLKSDFTSFPAFIPLLYNMSDMVLFIVFGVILFFLLCSIWMSLLLLVSSKAFLIELVISSAYIITFPLTFLAALPIVCINDIADLKNPSLSASSIATSRSEEHTSELQSHL